MGMSWFDERQKKENEEKGGIGNGSNGNGQQVDGIANGSDNNDN
jgi:hypothetical protein